MINQDFGKINLLSLKEKDILKKLGQQEVAVQQGESLPGTLNPQQQSTVNPNQMSSQQIDVRTQSVNQWISERSTPGDAGAAEEAALIYDLAFDGTTMGWLQRSQSVLNEMHGDIEQGNLPYNLQEIRVQIESLQTMVRENLQSLIDMKNIAETISAST